MLSLLGLSLDGGVNHSARRRGAAGRGRGVEVKEGTGTGTEGKWGNRRGIEGSVEYCTCTVRRYDGACLCGMQPIL